MSIDTEEVAKFARLSSQWWDSTGALRTLHDINPARIDFIEQHCQLKDQRILDIGCGGGILSEGLAKKGGVVTGLDVEPDAIGAAQAHAKEMHLKINYVSQSIETYVAQPYPIITCMEMLEHVPDPQCILNEAARLLAPQGYLFLSTIHRNLLAYCKVIVGAEYILNLLPRQTHDYQKFIKPSELASMLRKVSLEVVAISGLAYHPISHTASLTASVVDNYLMVARSTL